MISKTFKVILGVLTLMGSLFFMYSKPVSISYADDLPVQDISQYTIPAMVTYYADKYGVDQKLAQYIASHESEYDPNDTGDLTIT